MVLDLRQLRYVIAVAEERNITRAAERLDMQPPPLSRQIQAIERELGVRLFRRKARGVDLTDAGRVFLDNARSVLTQLDQALDATRRTARGEQGRICVAYSSTVAFHPLVPRIIREFRKAFALVTVTLIEGFPENLVERMQHDQVDVCFIRRLDTHVQGVDSSILNEESMVVALPSAHRLAQSDPGARLPLKALAKETFILFGDPHGDALQRNSAFAAACHDAGFSPHVGQVVPYISSRLNLIAAGLGIAVVAASLEHAKIEGVTFRRLKGAPQLKAPFSVAYRRGESSPVVRQFLRLAKQAAASDHADSKATLTCSDSSARRRLRAAPT
jgi:DNA-binding transcriptional LysR family regulator